MRDTIFNKLKEIENLHKVKIFYAAESGSRGWGFESKDSDYDVRFIYLHHPSWYLSIKEKRDVIEYPKSDSLDINGWDIRKALRLFKRSNPPLYEWLNSSIVYLEEGSAVKKMKGLIPKFYSPKASLHHYLSMATKNYKAYLRGRRVKTKKYFYSLRPILACMWIEKKKGMPPMEFEKLLKSQKLSKKLVKKIENLLERKRAGTELGEEKRIAVINKFLEERMRYFENYAKMLNPHRPPEAGLLDDLFRGILSDYWGE